MLAVPRHGITNVQLSSITDGSDKYSLCTRLSGVEDMLISMRPLQLLAFTALLTSLAITAPAEAQIRIHGTLLGADGQPMAEAHVIVQDWPVDTSIVATADERGRFSLTLPETGDYGMYLTGVHHKPLKVPLILTETKPVKLRVRLGTYNYESTLDGAKVKTIPHEYWDMQNENGTFVTSQPVKEDTLAYKIVGAWPDSFGQSRLTVSGTKADRYKLDKRSPIWDTTGDYISILKDVGTEAKVTFRPDDLPAPGQDPTVQSDNPTVERIIDIYQETERINRRIQKKARSNLSLLKGVRSTNERKSLRDSLQRDTNRLADSLRASVKQQIQREDIALHRQWLMLRYFDALDSPERDSTLAQRVLQEVPPTSPFWSYEAWSRVGASSLIAELAEKADRPGVVNSYMDEVIQTHPNQDVRRQFLYQAIQMAENAGDEERKRRYYEQMMSTFYGTWHAKEIEKKYSRGGEIRKGRPIPDYSLTAMEDTSVTYTDENMRGTVYLIDVWATWCVPCIEKMEKLHNAYNTYREKGFEILTVSFDEHRKNVEEFREKRWPMPWKHHFAGPSEEKRWKIEQIFDVDGLPHPILVDKNGQIIAAGREDFRKESLTQRLQRVFEKE